MRIRGVVVAVVVVLACVTCPAPAQGDQGFRIVVHANNPTGPMSADEVSQFFLKSRSHWGHGASAMPVDQSSSSRVREVFSEEIHRRPLAAVQSYWQKKIFSGSAVPPLEVESDAEVVAFVAQHAGGIGYVSPGADLSGVKVVPVSHPAERVKHVAPRYPPLARRVRAQGVVQLRVLIDRDGDVSEVTVVRGLAHGLTEEAVRAVRQWKYRPATVDGEPVESSLDVSVQFQL